MAHIHVAPLVEPTQDIAAAFTYWRGRMWHDIRMEKYIGAEAL